MTKKVLLKWVDQQEEKVLDDLHKKLNGDLAACKDKIYQDIGLDSIAAKIQAKFNEIETMLTEWQSKLEKAIIGSSEWYGSLHTKVNCYINGPDATKNMLMTYDVKVGNSKAYNTIIKKYDDLEQKVRHEYASVYANVQGLKNAALGMEYLESLGFDLTKLKEAEAKPVTTALSVPINTNFLFLGGTA